MKENKILKYIKKEEFNSDILKQYDKEGQKQIDFKIDLFIHSHHF